MEDIPFAIFLYLKRSFRLLIKEYSAYFSRDILPVYIVVSGFYGFYVLL